MQASVVAASRLQNTGSTVVTGLDSMFNLPGTGVEPMSPASAGRFFTTKPPGKPKDIFLCMLSLFSHVQLFATLWTIAHWTPLSMRFSRQKYWNGLPFPSPGHLPNQGSNPHLLCLLHGQVGSLAPVPPGKPKDIFLSYLKYGVKKVCFVYLIFCTWII